MKNKLIPSLLAVCALSVGPIIGQARAADASPSAPAGAASPAAEATSESQTMSGRITKVDVKTGIFSVRNSATRKPVELKAGPGIDPKSMQRGQRVTVTYSGNVASAIEANRSAK